MSFTNLLTFIEQYTNMRLSSDLQDGSHQYRYVNATYGKNSSGIPTAGNKKLPQEISNYLLYNRPSNYGGPVIDSTGNFKMSSSEIQTIMDSTAESNSCGVDCTGFAYYVLNEASSGKVRQRFEITQPGQTSYANGIYTMNFYEYNTCKTGNDGNYGTLIKTAKYVVPGAVMCTANGDHIIVIYNIVKDSYGKVTKIEYAHSNGSKGAHKGYIIINDENQNLGASCQQWVDIAYTDSQAKGYYNYTYMLNCLK